MLGKDPFLFRKPEKSPCRRHTGIGNFDLLSVHLHGKQCHSQISQTLLANIANLLQEILEANLLYSSASADDLAGAPHQRPRYFAPMQPVKPKFPPLSHSELRKYEFPFLESANDWNDLNGA
jgi:hypothetical protein